MPRAGAPVAVTFGLGTMAGSLGPTVFGHLQDALCLFGAFVIGSRARRPRDWVWVGLLAGVGVLFEYPAALAAIPLLVYAAIRGGRRAVALGASPAGYPPAIVLGGYDWLAFGAPWRLSYRYTSNVFTAGQTQGFFGIGAPTLHGIWTLTFDGHGLLLVSPVLFAAVGGPRPVLAPLTSRGGGRRGDLAAVLPVHGRLFPAERRNLAGPAVRRRGAAVPVPRRPFRARALAGRDARPRRRSRSAWALFDELTWSVANRLEFLTWPETIWSLAGLSRREGSIVLLACGAATGFLVLAVAASRRFEERPEAVVRSTAA